MCEIPQAFMSQKRKARKNHRCCECFGIISASETYNYYSGIWDSTPDSFKTCEQCQKLGDEIMKDDPYNDCREFGGLCDMVSNYDRDHDFYIRYWKNREMRKPVELPIAL